MSNMDCDYQGEIAAAMQMADTAVSNIERFDWLFLALAWKALSHCHHQEFRRTDSDQISAGTKAAPIEGQG